MIGTDPFLVPDLDQKEVLALVDELIRDSAAGADCENPTLDRYLDGMHGWLSAQKDPAWDSLERRMVGHILWPPGDFTLVSDYLTAVRRRVESPSDGWPPHFELPQPPWSLIGTALHAACFYE
jgi:hypothetical protein